MKPKRKKRGAGLLVCYLLVIVLYLAVCGILLLRDVLRTEAGLMPYHSLSVEDFPVQEGVKMLDSVPGEDAVRFISIFYDPYFGIEFPEGIYAGRFVVRAEPLNKGCGEMMLYYTTRPGEDFSDRQKLWAQQDASGAWVFDLGGKKVYGLRWDPDTVSTVVWRLDSIELNVFKPAIAYFWPNAQTIAVLLTVPVLLWAVLAEGVAFVQPMLSLRRFETRWRKEGRKEGQDG